MQQSSKLRNRVVLTAQRMNAAADMLTQLERHKAENDERIAYYRSLIDPLARANGNIDTTMERLFKLIESGFGTNSIQPLNEISGIVTELLTTDPLEDMVSFEEFKASAHGEEKTYHFEDEIVSSHAEADDSSEDAEVSVDLEIPAAPHTGLTNGAASPMEEAHVV